MDLQEKRVLVAGFGKTGKAVCRFLTGRGARITVSESRPVDALREDLSGWEKQGVRFETGGHTRRTFLSADLIVPSPGIPPIPELRAAAEHGVAVISEVELAYHFLRGRIIGITGSNGKSTVTAMTHRILKEAGLPAFPAGNIGYPLISFVEDSGEDHIFVTELSSFQLEHTREFRPHIAVLLNITPDHIDWHGQFRNYAAAKAKLLAAQRASDFAVLNRDDARVWDLGNDAAARVYGFSRVREVIPGCFSHGNNLVINDTSQADLMPQAEIPLPGAHNLENAMAAALSAHLMGIPGEQIRTGLRGFRALEHRLEKVRILGGVTFYNDSKATNVDAALTAIRGFDRPQILIMGGRDKGGDFGRLHDDVARRARSVLLLGEAGDKLAAALEGAAPLRRVRSMRDAVAEAFAAAEPGDIVLLAPACTSFDMFESFEHRGREFKREVMTLNQPGEDRHG